MTDPRPSLSHWIPNPATAVLTPLGEGSSFSGARLWRVDHEHRSFVLREWPAQSGAVGRINLLCGLQTHLAAAGLPVPRPLPTMHGGFVACAADPSGLQPATLSTWLSGVADYWTDPRPEKLDAALRMLATVHQSAAEFATPDELGGRRIAASPAMRRRFEKLNELNRDGLAPLHDGVKLAADANERILATDALELIARTHAPQRRVAQLWRARPLPLQWRLGDVWHDHVLFTGNRVTGLIDFGAAGVDFPAGDVARLLGSIVGDDPAGWRQGFAAYEAVWPLSLVERDAVRFFDASGTILSAANWIGWLWPKFPAEAPEIRNRPAALERLRRLVGRLQFLADNT